MVVERARLFLSYSRKDGARVADISRVLDVLGHDVWRDTEDLHGGEAWRRSIVQGIRASDVVVLLLSPNSTVSDNVRRELDIADEERRPVLPRGARRHDGARRDALQPRRAAAARSHRAEPTRCRRADLGRRRRPSAGAVVAMERAGRRRRLDGRGRSGTRRHSTRHDRPARRSSGCSSYHRHERRRRHGGRYGDIVDDRELALALGGEPSARCRGRWRGCRRCTGAGRCHRDVARDRWAPSPSTMSVPCVGVGPDACTAIKGDGATPKSVVRSSWRNLLTGQAGENNASRVDGDGRFRIGFECLPSERGQAWVVTGTDGTHSFRWTVNGVAP